MGELAATVAGDAVYSGQIFQTKNTKVAREAKADK